MSEPMKKLPTDALKVTLKKITLKRSRRSIFSKDKVNKNTSDIFSDLNQKYSKSGAILKGARLKEGLSQKKLAEQMKIPQSHISEMEHGKRTIDKKTSQRFSKILKINYKIFL